MEVLGVTVNPKRGGCVLNGASSGKITTNGLDRFEDAERFRQTPERILAGRPSRKLGEGIPFAHIHKLVVKLDSREVYGRMDRYSRATRK